MQQRSRNDSGVVEMRNDSGGIEMRNDSGGIEMTLATKAKLAWKIKIQEVKMTLKQEFTQQYGCSKQTLALTIRKQIS